MKLFQSTETAFLHTNEHLSSASKHRVYQIYQNLLK